jgi:hypothetical protein
MAGILPMLLQDKKPEKPADRRDVSRFSSRFAGNRGTARLSPGFCPQVFGNAHLAICREETRTSGAVFQEALILLGGSVNEFYKKGCQEKNFCLDRS